MVEECLGGIVRKFVRFAETGRVQAVATVQRASVKCRQSGDTCAINIDAVSRNSNEWDCFQRLFLIVVGIFRGTIIFGNLAPKWYVHVNRFDYRVGFCFCGVDFRYFYRNNAHKWLLYFW